MRTNLVAILMLVVLLLVPMNAIGADAVGRLLDLLIQKGVITKEEGDALRKEVQEEAVKGERLERDVKIEKETIEAFREDLKKQEPTVLAGYDKGFYIKSLDDQFLLRFNAGTRIQFTLFPDDTPRSNTSLRVRRFRPSLSGYVFKMFEYKVSAELADRDNILQSAWVNVNYRSELQLKFGQFKAPFSRERLTSSLAIETIERSVIADELAPGEDLGAQVHGRLFQNIVEYRIGIFQGAGRNTFDNNDDKDWIGRVVVKPFLTQQDSPLRGLSLGANFQVGRQPFNTDGGRTRFITRADRAIIFNATTRGLRQRYGGDIRYDYDAFSFQGEFIYERQRRDQVLTAAGKIATIADDGVGDASDVERFGGYVQVGYFVWGNLDRGIQLVTKYERFEADDTGDPSVPGAILSQSLDHYTLGLNWFINQNAKLQINGILEDLGRPITAFGEKPRGAFLDGTLNWVLLSQFQLWF